MKNAEVFSEFFALVFNGSQDSTSVTFLNLAFLNLTLLNL